MRSIRNETASLALPEVGVGTKPSADRWKQIEEWVRTSYTLVAPKKLAKLVLAEDGVA